MSRSTRDPFAAQDHRHLRMLTSLALAALCTAPSVGQAEPLVFPIHGEHAKGDVYAGTRGHSGGSSAVDFGRVRWDSNASEYTTWRDGASEPYTIEDHLNYGTPLYAPAAGYVVACYRNVPDVTTFPFENQCDSGCPPNVTAMGNFVQIVFEDDETKTYRMSHFQFDTIPESLCPNPNTPADSNGSSTCTAAGGGWSGFPAGTRLAEPYPVVQQGDYLGVIGQTGNSSSPHGHIQISDYTEDPAGRPCQGSLLPIEWYEGWYQARTQGVAPTDTWSKMNGTVFVNGDPLWIRPDAIGRLRSDIDYTFSASNLDITTHADGEVIAYLNEWGALRLRSYGFIPAQLDYGESDLVVEATVNDVALTRPNDERDVIATIRGSNGLLKLIPYSVSSSGSIVRQNGKEYSAGAVGAIASTRSPVHAGVVVALEDGSGDLKVIDFHTNASLTITRNFGGSGSGGAIDDVEITDGGPFFDGVVTAELAPGSGQLRMRSFWVPGGVFDRDVVSTFVAGTEVDVDAVSAGFGFDGYVVSSVLQHDGTIRVDSWSVDSNGDLSWVDGQVTEKTYSTLDTAPVMVGRLVSAARDGAGDLDLLQWTIQSDGRLGLGGITEFGPIQDAVVSDISIFTNRITALVNDGDDDMRLQTFDENFSFGL